MLKVGEMLETAVWADGKETEEQMQQFKHDLQEQLNYFAEQEEVIISPLVVTEKKPGEERVPDVPDDIQGPNVRLIVGEARVLAPKPKFKTRVTRFIDDLEEDDLNLLRQITRRAYKKHHPKHPELTDFQCDQVIESLGPDTALDTLRSGTIQ